MSRINFSEQFNALPFEVRRVANASAQEQRIRDIEALKDDLSRQHRTTLRHLTELQDNIRSFLVTLRIELKNQKDTNEHEANDG